MQFHEYTTFRTLIARGGDTESQDVATSTNSAGFRRTVLEQYAAATHQPDAEEFNNAHLVICEEYWVHLQRPYYNVWPIAVSLAPSVKLNLQFRQVEIPFDALLLRFARGHEPHNLKTAMVFLPKGLNRIHVFLHFADEAARGINGMEFGTASTDEQRHFAAKVGSLMTFIHQYEPNDVVEEWFETLGQRKTQVADYQHAAGLLIVRLVVFIALLSQGEDFITPIVLAKDRAKYESNDDIEVKRWLEDRAARRAGRGFDVGKKIQLLKDTSPHWRNPHLCLFWTGEGRARPIIKTRSGAIVQSVSLAEVPTGYLGAERDEEDELASEKTPREFFSKRRRFEIMKRDHFRCQLCGISSAGGAQLHIDHRVPLSKGGSNEEDNLWTLCDRCNLGKSDILL